MSNEELILKVKEILEKEAIKSVNSVDLFSEDVINTAYQKISTNVMDLINKEEDPIILAEITKNFLETTKMVKEKDINRQNMLIKLFEQLNKYEQSRYY